MKSTSVETSGAAVASTGFSLTPSVSLKRALLAFVLAYSAITVLAFGLYVVVATVMGASWSSPFHLRQDPAYQLAERIYPLLNLFVWGAVAWLVLLRRSDHTIIGPVAIGSLWLALALPLDLFSFVLVPNPLSVSANDFYIGQFPWIYLTYLAVFLAPIAAALTMGLFTQRHRLS